MNVHKHISYIIAITMKSDFDDIFEILITLNSILKPVSQPDSFQNVKLKAKNVKIK